MSVYKSGDIVEFVNHEHVSEFGLIISVQVSDTISALVVSGFRSNKPQWISTDRVTGHWRNVKDYMSACDLPKAEICQLRRALGDISDGGDPSTGAESEGKDE